MLPEEGLLVPEPEDVDVEDGARLLTLLSGTGLTTGAGAGAGLGAGAGAAATGAGLGAGAGGAGAGAGAGLDAGFFTGLLAVWCVKVLAGTTAGLR